MTGREKLKNIGDNLEQFLITKTIMLCPNYFGLCNSDNCTDGIDCADCWKQALEKEYAEEGK